MTIDWPSFLFGAAVAYAAPIVGAICLIAWWTMRDAIVFGRRWMRDRSTPNPGTDEWYSSANRWRVESEQPEEKKH